MTALPYSRLVVVPAGQPASAGQGRTAGQPDAPCWEVVKRTAAGTPVFVFNPEPWARVFLVTVEHEGEWRHSWVVGSPRRLTDLAARIGVVCFVKDWLGPLDEALPPVEPRRGVPC